MATQEQVFEALKKVQDPELHLDVVTLGLIYKVDIDDRGEQGSKVKVLMTLTTPFCPYGPQLVEEMKYELLDTSNIRDVDIEITFDPPWDPPKDIMAMLGV